MLDTFYHMTLKLMEKTHFGTANVNILISLRNIIVDVCTLQAFKQALLVPTFLFAPTFLNVIYA